MGAGLVGLGGGCVSLGWALGRSRSWRVEEERHSCVGEVEGQSCYTDLIAVVVVVVAGDVNIGHSEVKTGGRRCSYLRGEEEVEVDCIDLLDAKFVLDLEGERCCSLCGRNG